MLVKFYPSYSAISRKQSGIAGLTCFLPCISFTRPYECHFKFTFNYEHRKVLDRDYYIILYYIILFLIHVVTYVALDMSILLYY